MNEKRLKDLLTLKYNIYQGTVKDPFHLIELTTETIEDLPKAVELADDVYFNPPKKKDK